MSVLKTVRVALAACVLLLAASSLASAEIVFMTSGGTLSVKAHAIEGESIILTLRTGGQVTCDKTLIEKIVPDEVQHPDPAEEAARAAAAAAAQAAVTATPIRTRGLKETGYSDLITSTAEAYGVSPILVQALIQVESNYQPRARSSKGAMGLMQLMPSTAKEYKVRNAYDPSANVAAGVQKLKTLIDGFKGDLSLALAAYNAGEAAVAKFGGIPPYRETQNYVSSILRLAGLR
jgi:membrane-bound lytic murein transglycosylase B